MSEEEVKNNGELDGDEAETEIRDTDIVFDCPHCGHNLAIDYRGAGLQISCVNCGQNVLVPIPDGMKIDDLDIEPGEILKLLAAAPAMLNYDIDQLMLPVENMAGESYIGITHIGGHEMYIVDWDNNLKKLEEFING